MDGIFFPARQYNLLKTQDLGGKITGGVKRKKLYTIGHTFLRS